ncbi:hypothetical protein niasHS_016658 [Heterodera schachtii]|uniref:Uncharacterized protein n=1 Tax=Heterodera schachtii TaxID=97005 RepID=A0ABD2HSR2_HETSC
MEPDEFKTLFAEWEEENELREGGKKKHSEEKLSEVIAERTKHQSAEKLRRRELSAAGCNTKHLEQYLSEVEFLKKKEAALFRREKTIERSAKIDQRKMPKQP